MLSIGGRGSLSVTVPYISFTCEPLLWWRCTKYTFSLLDTVEILDLVTVVYNVHVCNVMVVCGEVERESEGHVTPEGRLSAVSDECCDSTDGDADICRYWWHWLHCRWLSCADNVSSLFILTVVQTDWGVVVNTRVFIVKANAIQWHKKWTLYYENIICVNFVERWFLTSY